VRRTASAVQGRLWLLAGVSVLVVWCFWSPDKRVPDRQLAPARNATVAMGQPRPHVNAAQALPRFVEREPGVFEAAAPSYVATLTKAGTLSYRATSEPTGNLELNLKDVRRGSESTHPSFASPELRNASTPSGAAVTIDRGNGILEKYVARGDGVEQLFTLQSLPAGAGDLAFVFDVKTQGTTVRPQDAGRHGGISFVSKDSGRVAARYGQVLVRDARGRSLVIEPTLGSSGAEIVFSVPERWLAQARFPVVIDPLVGSNIALAQGASQQVSTPTVAAGTNKFLVAWVDYRYGGAQVVGAIVTSSGLASGPYAISASGGAPQAFPAQRIQAVYDGTNWLVVWSDSDATYGGVYGNIVDSNGTVQGNAFQIAAAKGTANKNPLVAYDGTDWLVAWEDLPSGASSGRQIYFCKVASGGIVTEAQAVPSAITPLSQRLYFLTSQTPSGDTLLVYTEEGQSPAQTRSTRIATDRSIRDPGGTALFKEDITDGGYGRPIGVVFHDGSWQVLSSPDQTLDSSVFQHKISTSGTVTAPTGVFAEMGLGPSGSSADYYAGAAAGTDEWLFLRTEKVSSSVYHVIGKRVPFAGGDKDPIPFQIDTATTGILRSPIGAQSGNYFLATWLDGRDAATQPGDASGVYAALVDTTATGSSDTPLVAMVNASPTSGENPLTVSFSSVLSTGDYDTLKWDFDDGHTSTDATVSHTYSADGTYLAQLKLTKGAYEIYDTVVITVGTGGSSATQVGVPVQNSPGMVTGLFLSSVGITLNFKDSNKDNLRVTGIIDVGSLPDDLTGVLGGVSVGTYTASYNLDVNGAYQSDTTTNPVTKFALDRKTGAFVFVTYNADLRSAMSALGLKDEDVKASDEKIVNVSVSMTVGGFSATATCGVLYRAVADNYGNANYVFLGTGDEVSGSFLITKFAAKESTAKDKTIVHSYSIAGQLTRPNATKFIPGSTGEFVFSIGNYTTRLPAGQFTGSKGKVKFAAKKAASGLTQFNINSKGIFSLKAVKVRAEGDESSGLPLAKSGNNIVKVDLNFSVQFDLAEDQRLSAGRFIFIERKNADAKAWKLRDSQ
jgi:hypothetical protein